MASFTRQELEEAFDDYRGRSRVGGETGNWDQWADQFTDDAVYVEALFGRMEGQAAIRRWITETMTVFPNNQFTSFPLEWVLFDEDRGWVVCELQSRLADPGDGSVFQVANYTRLIYAGDGKWSFQEDAYNPQRMSEAVTAWMTHLSGPLSAWRERRR